MLSGLKNRNFIVYKIFTLTIIMTILVVFSILISFKYNRSFSKTYYEEKRYNNSEDNEDYLNKKFDKVSSDSPAITVLTHGVGGDASHWSNLSNYSEYFNDNEEKKHKHKLYQFAYTENSLIQRICDVTNANLYHVVASKSGNTWNYKFKNLSLQQIDKSTVDGRIYNTYSNNYPEGDPRENKLFETSKHSVVVFSLDSNYKSNDIVYEEFKYAMNRIITDFANINNGIAPRINLIGHSRGGLTNFQYMLDYPELVANFYSIGTPFCGSNTLDLASELGLKKFTIKKQSYKSAYYDLYVNYGSKKWQKYIERWNENYNKKYKHINAHAIGGYSSLATFLRLLAMSENVLGGKLGFVKYIPVFLLDSFCDYLYSKIGPFMKIINEFCESNEGILGTIKSIERFIEENIQPGIENIFRNDGLVGLDSQLGQDNGYYLDGFKRHQIKYTISNSRHKKLSEDEYAVVHNMEARSYQVINYIMDNLDFGVAKNDFMTTNLSDGTIGIVQYVGEKKDVYVVPERIKDKPVSVIFEGAFEFANIRKIILPATIREIREGAFANNKILNEIDMGNLDMNGLNGGIFENCTYLQHVKFPKNLEVIGERCFVNTGLERIKIPNTVVAILSESFAYNRRIKSVYLSDNLRHLRMNSFLKCLRLEKIETSDNSLMYESVDGVLYSKDKGILFLYPEGKIANGYTYKIIDECRKIYREAFRNARYIKTINLNNVTEIYQGAFYNCYDLEEVHYKNIEYIGDFVFDKTKFINSGKERITLGHYLIKYNGSENIIGENILDNSITKISSNAFKENIEKLVIPKHIQKISDYAFFNSNVSKLYGLNDNIDYLRIAKNSNLWDTKIYLTKKGYQKQKLNSPYYKDILDNLSIIKTKITFSTDDGKTYDKEIYYGDTYKFDLPLPNNTKYIFKDKNNNLYHERGIWSTYKENIKINVLKVGKSVALVYGDKILLMLDVAKNDKLEIKDDKVYLNNNLIYTLPKSKNQYEYIINNLSDIIEITLDENNIIISEKPIKYNARIHNFSPDETITHDFTFTIEDIEKYYLDWFKCDYYPHHKYMGIYSDDKFTDEITQNNYMRILDEKISNLYIKWEKKKYIVKFYNEIENKDNDDTGFNYDKNPKLIKYFSREIDALEYLELPKYEKHINYYNPICWYIKDTTNKYFEFNEIVQIDRDINFYLKLNKKQYKINYINVYNVSHNPNPSVYEHDPTGRLELLNLSTKQNPVDNSITFEFAGWFDDRYFQNKIVSIDTSSPKDITLYARWKVIKVLKREKEFTVKNRIEENDDLSDILEIPRHLYDVYPQEVTEIREISFNRITPKYIAYPPGTIIKETVFYPEEIKYGNIKISINLNLYEINEGYQHIYVYGEFMGHRKLYEKYISHDLGKKPSDYNIIYESDDVSFKQYYKIIVKYGASGFGKNDWVCKSSNIKIEALQTQYIPSYEVERIYEY